MTETYQCNRCKEFFPRHEVNRNHTAGRNTNRKDLFRCKRCVRLINLATRYGVSDEEIETQLRRQSNKCPVCLVTFESTNRGSGSKSPHIDHDHEKDESGRRKVLRGFLCADCNKSLGRAGDSLAGFEDKFRSYLENPVWQITGQLELDLQL
jgi:hypothetical protein